MHCSPKQRKAAKCDCYCTQSLGRYPSGQREQPVKLLRKLRWFESSPAHHSASARPLSAGRTRFRDAFRWSILEHGRTPRHQGCRPCRRAVLGASSRPARRAGHALRQELSTIARTSRCPTSGSSTTRTSPRLPAARTSVPSSWSPSATRAGRSSSTPARSRPCTTSTRSSPATPTASPRCSQLGLERAGHALARGRCATSCSRSTRSASSTRR